jgi:HK97 family phage prohead protease
MPWHIGQHESCHGFAVIKDSDGSVAGCHGSEEGAKRQLAALYAAEPESRAAKYDHINFKPPSGVRAEAQKGLDWRSEFGRGGTGVGIARARDLSNGVTISPETARRMKAFFDRHQSDKNAEGWSPGEKGFPSNGRIAHALWGGDAGYAWSRKLVRQMEAAENRGFCKTGQGGGIDNSCSSKDGGGGDNGPLPTGWKQDSKAGDASREYRLGPGVKSGSGNEGSVHYDLNGEGGWHGSYTNSDKNAPKSRDGNPNRDGDTQGTVTSKAGGREPFKTRQEAVDWVDEQHSIYEDSAKSRFQSKPPDFSDPKTTGLQISNWQQSKAGKKALSKKQSGGNSGGKKRRSDEMPMIETRALCLDDFSEDDAFPLLTVERRCCEERADGPEETWLVGYAARFGVNSLKMDDFYERIDPSAFSLVSERRGRKSPLETRALFNHDPNILLGRFPNTLRMKVDEMGLRYEIKMPESRRDIVESIERGDIRGSSFSFVVAPGGEEWSAEEGRSIRTVKSIASLIDVGPVTFPAYPDASVAVARRSYDEFMRGQQARRSELDAIRGHRAEIQKFLRERGR